jgi:DNA-binding response OmpR family regulator
MDTQLKILIIEDHDALRVMMVAHLSSKGYLVEGVDSGAALDSHLTTSKPDILVIDLTLPIEDGLSIAKRIRTAYPQIHIIMLTARVAESDRVEGYESGADIYLTKPVSVAELEASIRSITRRQMDTRRHTNELWLDVISMRLEKGSHITELTRQETQLLRALNEAPLQFLPAWALLEKLGKDTDNKNRSNLDVAITRLRKKLLSATGQEGTLKVARNAGYQLTIRLRMK